MIILHYPDDCPADDGIIFSWLCVGAKHFEQGFIDDTGPYDIAVSVGKSRENDRPLYERI